MKTKFVYYALPLFLLATTVLYWTCIGTQRFGDDFAYVYSNPKQAIYYHYLHRQPNLSFYRPLQDTMHGLIQTVVGMETWPIQCTHILLHGLLAWMVFRGMLLLGFTSLEATIGSLFMAISQANVIAVTRTGYTAPIGSTLAGFAALFVLCKEPLARTSTSVVKESPLTIRPNIFSLFLFSVALFFKEWGVSFLLIIPFVLLLLHREIRPWKKLCVYVGSKTLPYVVLFLIYYIIRSRVALFQPQWGAANDTSEYFFCIGPNVLRNLGMLFFSTLTPFSTVDIFASRENAHWGELFIYSTLTLLLAAIILYGLWRQHKPQVLIAVFACYLLGLFPMVLLTHISELYTYNAMPFAAILVGTGIGKLLETQWERRATCGLMIVFTLSVAAVNIFAVRSKIALLREKGSRATVLITKIVPIMNDLPPNARLLLVNPPSTTPEYSAFRLDYFSVLRYTSRYLATLAHRPDITVEVVRQSDALPISENTWSVVLSKGKLICAPECLDYRGGP